MSRPVSDRARLEHARRKGTADNDGVGIVTLGFRCARRLNQVQAFVDESRTAGLTPQQLGVLEAKVAEDQAWVHRFREFDRDATLKDYDHAAALDPGGSCLPCGPVGKKADLLRNLNRYSDAAIEYSRLLAFDPKSTHALDGRGASFFAVHQVAAAQGNESSIALLPLAMDERRTPVPLPH